MYNEIKCMAHLPVWYQLKNLGKRFPQKRVIITGGGSGLGRAMALVFAGAGWKVCIAEKNIARGKAVSEEIDSAGGEGLLMECDVTRPDDLERLRETLVNKWGGVDILVNNAGVAAAGLIEEIPQKTWDWILDINLKSVVYACRIFVPLFKQQKVGHIVNVASYTGFASFPEMSCYNVSKAAIISLSESLRSELATTNIGISVACPSFFKTGLMDSFAYTDERHRKLAEAFFNKAGSTAEDVACYIIRSIQKNRFYVVPHVDARIIWWFKRHFPRLYLRVLSLVYRKGLIEKYLGTS